MKNLTLTQAKLLVVEDEGITAEDIKDYLTSLGYDVLGICSTGEDAVEKARSLEPDLVLMDIRLAGVVDGIQAADIIREHYEIPVVYLTAYSDPQTLERAKITDPYGYVLKPFNQRDLQIAVEIALHKHKMQSRIVESERWLSTTVSSVREAIITVDAMYRVKTMNEAAERITGWREDDAKSRLFTQVYTTCHAATGEDLPTPIHLALETGKTVVRKGEALLIARGGNIHPVDETATLIVDPIKGVLGAVLVFRNASQRMEEEANYREDLIPAVLDSLSAYLVVTDQDGKIIRFNRKVQNLTGLSERDALKKFFWDLCWNSEETDFASSSFKHLNGNRHESTFDCRWKTKFDQALKIRWCNSVIRDDDEAISYIICTGVGLEN